MKLKPHETAEIPTKLITVVNRQVVIENETSQTITVESTDNQDALRPKLTIRLCME